MNLLKSKLAAVAVIAVTGIAAGGAVAQSQDARNDRPMSQRDPLAAPGIQEHDGVRYMTGGVGLGEREAMQRAASRFPLQMSFAERRNGQYLADVSVEVRDARGREVLDVPNAGPLLYVDLPPGSYRVSATFDGRTHTRNVRVGNGAGGMEHLTWEQRGANGSPTQAKANPS